MTRKLNQKDRRFAKKLAQRVAGAGEGVAGELPAIFETVLAGRTVSNKRAFLEFFRRRVERELRARELLIEHAGPLPADAVDTLVATFRSGTDRDLRHRLVSNPDLLGGVRLTLGDVVYDASLAARLRNLEEATAASLN